MNRARDWWVQAQADLRHARYALEGGHYEWACFAAHQAAEKGIQALFEHRGARVTGHALTRMLQALRDIGLEVDPNLLDVAKILDKFYVPTRYLNSLPEGAPTEFYTREEAELALHCAEQVLRFCAGFLGG